MRQSSPIAIATLISAAALAACASALAACGSSGDDAPPPTRAEAIKASCERLVEQVGAFEQACEGRYALPVDHYVTARWCEGVAQLPGSAIEAADIDGCSGELAALRCHEGLPKCLFYGANLLFPEHQKAGTLAAGRGCVAQLQCASGYCSGRDDQCGFCQTPKKKGEPCGAPTDVCVDEYTTCREGVCDYPGKRAGETCNRGLGWEATGDCQWPVSYCRTDHQNALTGVCTPRDAPGAACTGDSCAKGSSCMAGACTAFGEPSSPAVTQGVGPGGACDGSHLCSRDLECAGGRCAEPSVPPPGQGEECGSRTCAPGLFCALHCDGESCDPLQRCRPFLAPGESCSEPFTCGPDADCVGLDAGVKGTCVVLSGEGGSCPCRPDMACVSGRCVPQGSYACPGL